LIRRVNFCLGTVTMRWQVRQRTLISTPPRRTSHSLPPHGCGFLKRTSIPGSSLTTLLIFIFLVTSADSATFVLGMLSTSGTLNPPTGRKIAWGLVLALLGAAMLFTGNINALRAVVVSGAVPFMFIMLLQVVALLKALRAEKSEGGTLR